MESTGTRIRAIRKKAGLSQIDFSKKICISQGQLSAAENNKMCLSKAVLRLISILFDVNEDWLINGSK